MLCVNYRLDLTRDTGNLDKRLTDQLQTVDQGGMSQKFLRFPHELKFSQGTGIEACSVKDASIHQL